MDLLRLLIFPIFFLLPHKSFAKDSISVKQPLLGDEQLTSRGGNFVLGFFPLGNSPKRYYLGIWYNTSKVSELTPVWIANRDAPILGSSSSSLNLSEDGNLILLLNNSKSLIWSTNTTATSNSTVAVLLDSGNFVLRDDASNALLWQSIDHPADTWLPGAKLGLNKLTGETQRLVAWRSADDPSSGSYSFKIDPHGSNQYLLLWNASNRYWSSGPWNGKIFSGVPEMTSNYIFQFQYVSNSYYNYFTYTIDSDKIISRFVMDYSGQIKQLTWLPNSQAWILFWSQPTAQCEVYALCGPFGSCNENALPFCGCVHGFRERSPADLDIGNQSVGCVRNTALLCGSDGFYKMENVRLPADPESAAEAGSRSKCESACMKNCSCIAYSYGSLCSLWFGNLLNLQEPYYGADRATLFLRLAASELQRSSRKKKWKIYTAVGGIVCLLALPVVIWLVILKRRRRRIIRVAKASADGILVAFRYRDLQRVTKNFSEKLGGGGFGSVYKGVLPDLTSIAVKKLVDISQGEKQFRAEISTVGAIHHVNLIRLYGFCSNPKNMCLVYEFMPNNSLDAHLFRDGKTNLDWGKRHRIALGAARGLAYLHEKCRDCIIHCDVKPENILLDASFEPKVSDFGLAKLIGRDLSRVLTTVRGTRGYLAPEWISGVAITTKTDVYSYGMMLFEIISGRRNTNHKGEDDKTGFFPVAAMRKLAAGDVLSLLDPRLEGCAEIQELERACKVGFWCIQDDENCRPTMGQVVQMLEGVTEISMPPPPKSLLVYSGQHERILYFENSKDDQSNINMSSQWKSLMEEIRTDSYDSTS